MNLIEDIFYEKSEPSELLKLLAQYELYKKIRNVKGDIYEFGVFKGTGLIKWATFGLASKEQYKEKYLLILLANFLHLFMQKIKNS